jgi:hypothetical protein
LLKALRSISSDHVIEHLTLQKNMLKLWPKQTIANDCDIFKYFTIVLKNDETESFLISRRDEASLLSYEMLKCQGVKTNRRTVGLL